MWKSLINMVLSKIGIRKLVVPKEEPEMERTLPLLVRHWGETLTAPDVGMLHIGHFKCVNFIVAEKIKTGISLIFNYVVPQLKEAWHHDVIIKTWSRYYYQSSGCIIIAYSVDLDHSCTLYVCVFWQKRDWNCTFIMVPQNTHSFKKRRAAPLRPPEIIYFCKLRPKRVWNYASPLDPGEHLPQGLGLLASLSVVEPSVLKIFLSGWLRETVLLWSGILLRSGGGMM